MAVVQLATLAAEAREAIDNEDYNRAAAACLRALLRYPRWVEGYWLLGTVLVERDYLPQARACFEAAASAMPDDPRSYEGIAAVAEQQRDQLTAVAGLFRAIEVGETSQGVRNELQRLQRETGQEAVDVQTNARAAHARLLQSQFEAADLAAERGLQEEPDRLDLLVVQAVARLLGGDRRGGQRSAEHLVELSPDCLKALAILRYLAPVDQRGPFENDLDELDPEAGTLVWLRGQLQTRGFDTTGLPAEPRLVTWVAEETSAAMTQAAVSGRPLDRLIPELEQVLPQWLRDAAGASTPVPAESPSFESAPPSLGQPGTAAADAGFLGDVDVLAREFEEAMKLSPELTPTPAVKVATEPATEAVPTDTARAAGAEQEPAVAEEQPVAATAELPGAIAATEEFPTHEAEPVAAVTASVPEPAKETDEFAQWSAPPAPSSPAGDQSGAGWAAGETPAAAAVPEVIDDWSTSQREPAAPVAAENWDEQQVAPPAESKRHGERVEAALPVLVEGEWRGAEPEEAPAGAVPAATAGEGESAAAYGMDRIEAPAPDGGAMSAQEAGLAAARAGDYWTAIDRLGEALAALRAEQPRSR